MGWFATAQALRTGDGPYGNVRQSLKGEQDKGRTVRIALELINAEMACGAYVPDRAAKIRLRWWAKWAGCTVVFPQGDGVAACRGRELSRQGR